MSSFFAQTSVGQVPASPQVAPAPLPPPSADVARDMQQLSEQLEQLERLRALENLDIEAIVQNAMAQAAAQDQVFFGPHISGELIGLVLGALALIFLIVVGYPLARSAARKSELKAMNAAAPSGEVLARLERIEHAVETMAVEIERISEGQRYTTRLLSEQAGVSSGRQ